jgi:hypothetical protein
MDDIILQKMNDDTAGITVVTASRSIDRASEC